MDSLCSLIFHRRLNIQERIHLLYYTWHLLGDSHIHQSSSPCKGIMFRKYLSSYQRIHSCPVARLKLNFIKPPFYQSSKEYKFLVSNFLEKPKQTSTVIISIFLSYRSLKGTLCFSVMLWLPVRGSLLRSLPFRLHFLGLFWVLSSQSIEFRVQYCISLAFGRLGNGS